MRVCAHTKQSGKSDDIYEFLFRFANGIVFIFKKPFLEVHGELLKDKVIQCLGFTY